MIRVPKGVKALYYEKSRVGKHIKRSKKKHTWKFALDDVEHTVELYVSKLSSKRKIIVDGDIRASTKSSSGVMFSYPFKLGRHMLMVVQQETLWDLRIDSVSFQQLYAMQKPSTSFAVDDWSAAPGNDFKTSSSSWSQRPQEFEEVSSHQPKPWGERDDYDSFRPKESSQGLSEWEVYARPDPKNKAHAWDSREEEPRFPEYQQSGFDKGFDRGFDRDGFDDRGGFDRRDSPRGGFDHRESPRGGFDHRESPRGGFDHRESPRGGFDARESPKSWDRPSPAYKDRPRDTDLNRSPKPDSRSHEFRQTDAKPRSSTIPAPREDPKPKKPPVDLFDIPDPGHLPSDLFNAQKKESAPQLSFPSAAPSSTVPDVFQSSSPMGAQAPPQQYPQWQTAQPAPQMWPGGAMQPNPMMMNPMAAMMMNPFYTAMMTGQMAKPGANPGQRPF